MPVRRPRLHVRPHVQTLSDLIAEAQAYAVSALRVTGSVRPTLLALTGRGIIAHYPECLVSRSDKDRFVLEARLLLVAAQATMCAMVLESWMTDTPRGIIPDLPPAKHPDRHEVVVICAESRQEKRLLTLPICRTLLGAFASLGENTAPPELLTLGPFANLLKLRKPRTIEVNQAQHALEAMGIWLETGGPGFSES